MRTQQEALYTAEERCGRGRELHSLAEVEGFVREMLDAPWWHERYRRVKGIEVFAAKRGDGSVGTWHPDTWLGQIEMSPSHWCTRILCHEVAHVVAHATWGSTSHDPAFTREYLNLVYLMMGSEAFVELRTAFVEAEIEIG